LYCTSPQSPLPFTRVVKKISNSSNETLDFDSFLKIHWDGNEEEDIVSTKDINVHFSGAYKGTGMGQSNTKALVNLSSQTICTKSRTAPSWLQKCSVDVNFPLDVASSAAFYIIFTESFYGALDIVQQPRVGGLAPNDSIQNPNSVTDVIKIFLLFPFARPQ
jgi:hypothetical protein